jgi:hypothetical protein
VVLTWSNEAFAVVQNTDVAVTKPAGETGSATLTLTQKDSSNRTVKTDTIRVARNQPRARQTVRIDPDKAKTVDVTIETEKGKRTVTVDVARLLGGGPVDLGEGFSLQGSPSASAPGQTSPRSTVRTHTVPHIVERSGTISTPNSFDTSIYVGVTGAGTSNETSYRPKKHVSAGIDDVTNKVEASTSETNFNVGFILGFFMPNVGIFNRIALEAEFALLNNKSEIPGLPGLVGFPTAANDVLRFEKEWMLTMSMLVFMPNQYPLWRDFYVKLGIALIKERFEYDCRANGFCAAAPSTPAFTAADSTLALGFLIGLGYQWQLQQLGLPNMFLRIGWDHIFVGSNDMQAGNGATRFVAGAVENDVDRFYVTLAMSLSDARAKRDVVRIGQLDSGIPLYRYKYQWSDTEYVGVLAQEAARVQPDAVLQGHDGYLRVNYALLGTKLQTYEEWQARR